MEPLTPWFVHEWDVSPEASRRGVLKRPVSWALGLAVVSAAFNSLDLEV